MENLNCTIYEREHIYKQAKDYPKKFFSNFFKQKIGKILDEKGEEINKNTISKEKHRIADQLGIDCESFRKYINEQKPIKKRDFVVAICVLIKATSDETEDLFYYFEMKEWTPSRYKNNYSRDDIFIEILDNQDSITYSIDEVNEKLTSRQFDTLNIIDHKIKKNIRNIENVNYPYPLIKKKVECRADELIFGDQYNSLSTEYKINKYRIYATMWLRVSKNEYFELFTSGNSDYAVHKYNNVFDNFQSYNNIDETGEFKNCFMELNKMVESETMRIADILNDTKNYNGRRSAKVIDNEIHVFYEIYNYSIPEKNEYYFMDYVNGKYTLYVSPESIFMRFYLTDKEYSNIYGKSIERTKYLRKIEQYNSIEAMEEKLKYKDFFLKFKVSAFNKIKSEIDCLVDNLKSGKEHIGNFEDTYEITSQIFEHYKITKAFKCTYDSEGVIDDWAEKAKFYSDGNLKVELTIENLIEGFELGLGTIEEILSFLSKHNSLKILDCIE